jgi:hypothetical protein
MSTREAPHLPWRGPSDGRPARPGTSERLRDIPYVYVAPRRHPPYPRGVLHAAGAIVETKTGTFEAKWSGSMDDTKV